MTNSPTSHWFCGLAHRLRDEILLYRFENMQRCERMAGAYLAKASGQRMSKSGNRERIMNVSIESSQCNEFFVNETTSVPQKTEYQINSDRKFVVVVATPIAYRKAWYEKAFPRFDTHVVMTTSGVQCIEAMHNEKPDVLILEVERNWNCPHDVLRARSAIDHFQHIPVVLIARNGVGAEAYHLSSYVIQVFYNRLPSHEELAKCVSKMRALESKEGGK